MSPLLALLAPAAAAPYIVQVGTPQVLDQGGNWGRIHLVDGAPWLSFGWNRDLHVSPLTGGSGAWSVDESGRVQLSDRGDLSDHGIVRCGDGSFLHVASASLDSPNDSAFAWRYGADWSRLASGTVEEREPGRAHNDMAVICADLFVGVGFHDFAQQQPELIRVGADASAGEVIELPDGPTMTGGSILRDPVEERLVMAGNALDGKSIELDLFDAALRHTGQTIVTPLPDGWNAFWPQGLLAAGDVFLLATLGRPDTASQNSDVGDVFLVVLDRSFAVLETAQITTTNGDANGCLRPGIARDGTTLYVTCDRNNELVLTEVTLDLAAMGVDPDEDTGWDGEDPWADAGTGDSGGGEDGGDSSDADGDGGDAGGGCGCAAGPGGGGVGLAGLLGLLVGRRRRAA